MGIAENIAHIRERMAAAARRAVRKTHEITLMGVTKTFAADPIREAYRAGVRVFGEDHRGPTKQERCGNCPDAKCIKRAQVFHEDDH